jgi:hypothetical protein
MKSESSKHDIKYELIKESNNVYRYELCSS